MGVVVNLVIYSPYCNARADAIVNARVADRAFLEPVRVAGCGACHSHGPLGYQEWVPRDRAGRSENMIRGCSSEVDDTYDSENDNAQGPRARVSPASQDQKEIAVAVLKNVLY